MNKRILCDLGVATTAVCGIYAIFQFFPVAYLYLVAEDYWAEYASVICWMASSVLFYLTWRLERKVGFLAFSMISLLIGLEELSWGQRIFNMDTPYLLQQMNLQGEINLHNLINGHQTEYQVASFGVLVSGVFLPVLGRFLPWMRQMQQRIGIPSFPPYLLPYAVVMIGLFMSRSAVKFRAEELGEFVLAFILCRISLNEYRVARAAHGRQAWGVANCLKRLIVPSAIATVLLVLVFPGVQDLRWMLHHFGEKIYPKYGRYDAACKVFNHILEKPLLIKDQTHFKYGELLLRMGEKEKALEILEKGLAYLKKQQELGNDRYAVFYEGEIYRLLEREEIRQRVMRELIRKEFKKIAVSESSNQKVDSLILTGRAYVALDQPSKARRLLQKALRLEPGVSKTNEIKAIMATVARPVSENLESRMNPELATV